MTLTLTVTEIMLLLDLQDLGRRNRREGDIFGKNSFSGISFFWPQDQESSLGNMNFQNLIFVKRSIVHV